MNRHRGFLPGMGVGALVATLALILIVPVSDGADYQAIVQWLVLNLGNSGWLFTLVLVLFTVHLLRLRRLLDEVPDRKAVVELDQLTDVWTHLFIGIGVVWTAVGMRSALQVALGNPEQVAGDSPGLMLKRLVDGGILLALSTTIVGAVGGYLLRLAKTLYVGAALHAYYQGLQQGDVRELVTKVGRIERLLDSRAGSQGDGGAAA